MDRLKLIETFVAVATKGSLTAAARTEGVAPAVIGRRIDALEEHLGVKLSPQPTPGFATDASELCFDPPVPYIICGPGQEELAHKPDEYISIEDYITAITFYATLAERYLGVA